jgi:hypothetical protein
MQERILPTAEQIVITDKFVCCHLVFEVGLIM